MTGHKKNVRERKEREKKIVPQGMNSQLHNKYINDLVIA
jgi:hypothetical protein